MIRSKIIENKGDFLGQKAYLMLQYEGQDAQKDPWLDAALFSFYKMKQNSKLIIIEMQLIGIINEGTGATFRYPVQYTAQEVMCLNSLTHKQFFDKYAQDEKFLEERYKCMRKVIEYYQKDIDMYRERAKIMANN